MTPAANGSKSSSSGVVFMVARASSAAGEGVEEYMVRMARKEGAGGSGLQLHVLAVGCRIGHEPGRLAVLVAAQAGIGHRRVGGVEAAWRDRPAGQELGLLHLGDRFLEGRLD